MSNPEISTQKDSFPIIKNGIVYDVLKAEDLSGAVNCLAATFTSGEPIAKSLGITLEEFKVFAEVVGKKAVREELSIVARYEKTKEVLGCIICDDFVTDLPEDIDIISNKFAPVYQLLEQLDASYKQQYQVKNNEILHLFLLAVDREHRGKKIANSLVEASEKLGKLKGYKGAIAEATGPISQYIFIEKQNYDVIGAIKYQEFEFEGKRVFQNIEDCESCKLVYKKL